MLSLLVGGRGNGDEDDGEGPPARRRLSARGVLVLLGACVATGLAVAVPALLAPAPPPGEEQLAGPQASGQQTGSPAWESVRLCRTEPAGECVERGPQEAERLAGLLLPLRRVDDGLVTCLAVGERYAVLLRGQQAPPELTVDTACSPVLAGDARYEVSPEARAAVAEAWSGR